MHPFSPLASTRSEAGRAPGPGAIHSSRSPPDPATQRMVIRVYFSDGAFKSLMITAVTKSIEVCHMFAEKIRMERFQHNFQLKEVTPAGERMVNNDERPWDIVQRWMDDRGFKLSMNEKWRFVFTFSKEAHSRLVRKTKHLLFSQVQSELKQQLQKAPPNKPPAISSAPFDCPRPTRQPPSPRQHDSASSTTAIPPPVSPRVRASPLESSPSSVVDDIGCMRGGSLPTPYTPRDPVPSRCSDPRMDASPSLSSSSSVRRNRRPTPIMLRSFDITNEAQLSEVESRYQRDPVRFASTQLSADETICDAPSTSSCDSVSSTMDTPTSPVTPLERLPPPPSSMVLPPVPGSNCDCSDTESSEGEDELVSMLVRSKLQESQARGVTIRDCSEQMISNLDDALAMLAKLEFEL